MCTQQCTELSNYATCLIFRLIATEQVAGLLDMQQTTVTELLASLTSPLYKACVAATIAVVEEADELTFSEVTEKLALRQQELRLSDQLAQQLEQFALRERASELLSAAASFIRVQNVKQGVAAAKQLITYCTKMTSLMLQISHIDGDEESALQTLFGNLASSAKPSEVISLYRMLLLSALDKGKVTAEDSQALTKLRTIVGITAAQSASVYEAAAGPILRKVPSHIRLAYPLRNNAGMPVHQLGDKCCYREGTQRRGEGRAARNVHKP